ncbi:hypothetical protein N7481_007657 [Penicillium waksmanii]|uniref:uncharacterized protein n=1 Tax=Penicillium waksmanii TaxID=69791 RepID=UPI002546E357|nr:uncharacterized protein N7481_007657 [Penicillium waksmanii]KAJ5980359.1 hypothetical protein N7481_007657 [Penicillium waksmanii]
MRALCLHVLGGALSQARNNDGYLEYYDRQLWDLAEMVIYNWILIFQSEEAAVSEHIMSCIVTIFSQFLADQIRTRERQIARFLKCEKVEMGSEFCDDCPICVEEVKPGEYITTLAPFCTHWFNSGCINTWMMSDNEGNNTCPMCRTRLDLSGRVPRYN